MATTLIQIRSIAEPITGARYEFEVDNLPNIKVAEIWANFLAAEQSAHDRVPYYVSSVVLDSNNFVMNPNPEYWANQFNVGVERSTKLSGEMLPSEMITCRRKSVSC